MIVRAYGDTAVLIETDRMLALRDALTDLPGVEELVPGARTLLVRFDPHATTAGAVADAARCGAPAATAAPPGTVVELRVRYDGPDLGAVAERTGFSAAEVVARHTAGEYRVAFCGFSPGFAYLSGLDPALHLPRLASPRTSVPAGAVGVAGEYTGVYPRSSPGGWRLLGRTDAPLWDLARTPPALLTPGTRVRFVAR